MEEERSVQKRRRMLSLFEDERCADCRFIVGDKHVQEFKANRMNLARHSDVFKAMLFESPMRERSDSEVRITDCSPCGFRQLLLFVHELDLELDVCNVIDVVRIADKYAVHEMQDKARAWAEKAAASPCDAIKLLDHSVNSGSCADNSISEACACTVALFIADIAEEALLSSCSLRTMEVLLRREDLNCKEEMLWELLWKWVQGLGQPEGVWTALVPHVRFGLMSNEFFVDTVCQSGALTDSQKVELMEARIMARAAANFCSLPRRGTFAVTEWRTSTSANRLEFAGNSLRSLGQNVWSRALGKYGDVALASQPVTAFKVRIDEVSSFPWNINLGFASPNVALEDPPQVPRHQRNPGIEAWVYCCSSGRLVCMNRVLPKKFEAAKRGDVLLVLLREGGLCLIKNGVELGIAFRKQISGPVIPVIEMWGSQGNQISII